jgi:hypothetical protein
LHIGAAQVVDVIVENDALHYAAEFGEFERMSSGEIAATRELPTSVNTGVLGFESGWATSQDLASRKLKY